MPDPKGPVTTAEADSTIDTRLVRKLASILSDTGLTEIEVERGGLRVRVARQSSPQQVYTAPAAVAAPAPAATATAAAPVAAPAPAARRNDPRNPGDRQRPR